MSLYAYKDHFLQMFDNLGRFLRFLTPGGVNIPVRYTLLQSATPVSLTGSTAETALASVTIPGGMLGLTVKYPQPLHGILYHVTTVLRPHKSHTQIRILAGLQLPS